MKKKFIIGMAARITTDKRQDIIVDIAYKNKNYFKKNKVEFQLAGEGEMFSYLNEKINQYKLRNVIKLIGYLDEDRLVKWFRKLKIYIHLSKDETTSTSILQAMSMSLPVIASNIGGNQNFLKYFRGEPNIILTKNDSDHIFLILKNLMHSNKKINLMSSLSRKTIEKYYSSKKMFREYEKLFK